jgi:thioredoxin reductase (NADPH)
MINPTILVIDDDANVLNAVERDLRKKFGREYRLIKAASGASALETILELQKRNEAVALFLTDQRMPLMTGLQFLEQAREIYPEAKRVLLTAYADTDVAISSINKLVLDYYLMKPWDPPEDNLYPVVEDLLADWRAGWRERSGRRARTRSRIFSPGTRSPTSGWTWNTIKKCATCSRFKRAAGSDCR